MGAAQSRNQAAIVSESKAAQSRNQSATDSESMEICREDFRSDEGGTPEWDYVEMMEAGQSYLDLPVPRKLITPSSLELLLPPAKIEEISKKRNEAQQLLRYISPQYVSVLW